jgi:hypothetical protein
MRKIIAFYAWQSDTPQRFNRHLIWIALVEAAKRITEDSALDVELMVDQDTAGVPGQPPITDTILKKIAASDIFIPDLSFVSRTDGGKYVPNPNVMTEYGYALRAKTHEALMPVMNTAFGPPKELPFDMGHLRHPIQYCIEPTAKPAQRRAVRQALSQQIEANLRLQIAATQPPLPAPVPFHAAEQFEGGATFVASDTIFTLAVSHGGSTRNVRLPRGPKAFLRVQPVYNHLPLDRAEAAMALQKSGLPPPGWSRYGSHRTGLNKWGACTYISLPPSPEIILTISQIMLTRELWGIATDLFSPQPPESSPRVIAIADLENTFTEAVGRYLQTAEHILKISPPIKLIAGISGVSEYHIPVVRYGSVPDVSTPIFDPKIVHETELQSYKVDFGTILLPFYKKIWAAAQMTRPSSGVSPI